MSASAPELDPSSDDPFARMANALREEQAPARARPGRRSRPSFSDLAPVVPPPRPPEASPAPAVVVNRVHVVGDAEPSETASRRLSFVPTVIVSEDDPPSFSISHPAPARPRSDTPTVRPAPRGAPPADGVGASTVLFLLAISLAVFGAGLIALVHSRSSDAPIPAPRSDTAAAPAE